MAYSAAVERWRPIVAKYFPAELVDKALFVIQGESGGNPGAVGDGGAARGLFQIQDSRNFSNRPNAAYLDNPENNIKYAAEQLGAAKGNFSAWGEGSTYNGKPFGALGNNPYPGSSGGSSMTTSPTSATSRPDYETWVTGVIGPRPTQKDFPPDPNDAKNGDSPQARYSEALSEWVKNYAQAATAYRAAFPDAAGSSDYGPIQAGLTQQKIDQDAVTQQINLLDTQLKAGQIDTGTAQAKLSAFLTSRTQADQEAKLVADSNDLLAKYGVAPGHEKDTAKQWGDAFVTFAKLLGGDENSIPRDFTGQTAFSDPYGDIQRFRAQNGALGDAPSLGSSTAMTDMVNSKVPGLLSSIDGATAPRTYSNGGYSDQPGTAPEGIPGVTPGVGSPNGAFQGLNDQPEMGPSITSLLSPENNPPPMGPQQPTVYPMGPQQPQSLLADVIKRRSRGLLAGAF